jgi:hypothetical protein
MSNVNRGHPAGANHLRRIRGWKRRDLTGYRCVAPRVFCHRPRLGPIGAHGQGPSSSCKDRVYQAVGCPGRRGDRLHGVPVLVRRLDLYRDRGACSDPVPKLVRRGRSGYAGGKAPVCPVGWDRRWRDATAPGPSRALNVCPG